MTPMLFSAAYPVQRKAGVISNVLVLTLLVRSLARQAVDQASRITLEDQPSLAKLALSPRGLLGKDVAAISVSTLNLAASCLAEPLCGSAM
jgi:hypothetical protein